MALLENLSHNSPVTGWLPILGAHVEAGPHGVSRWWPGGQSATVLGFRPSPKVECFHGPETGETVVGFPQGDSASPSFGTSGQDGDASAWLQVAAGERA